MIFRYTRKENANKLQELIIKYYKACLENDELKADMLYERMGIHVLELCQSLIYTFNEYDFSSIGFDSKQEFGDIASDSASIVMTKILNHDYDPSISEYKELALINFITKIIEGQYKNRLRKMRNISFNTVQVESWLDEDDEEPERSQIERFEDCNISNDEDLYLKELQEELFEEILKLAKNDDDRELLNYVFIQELLDNKMTKTEIAAIFGCSVANITQRTKKFSDQMKENPKIIELLRIIVEMKNKK